MSLIKRVEEDDMEAKDGTQPDADWHEESDPLEFYGFEDLIADWAAVTEGFNCQR